MLSDDELQYYYFGFYKALKRYRSASLIGWSIVLVAIISVPFGWNLGRSTGYIEVVLTILTIFAGLALVWHAISSLEEYVRIPFSRSAPDSQITGQSLPDEIRTLMKEVDDGGWQEAYAAIGKLHELRVKHALPAVDRESP